MSKDAFLQLSEGLNSNTSLTDFFFTHNDLQAAGEGGVALIQSLANKKDLNSLALNSCNLDVDLLEELKNAIEGHTSLKELYLFANKIEQEGAPFISAMIQNKTLLSCIGLSNNKLGQQGAIEIAESGLEGKRGLTKISIENNCIGNQGLKALSLALNNCTQIQEFYLYNNEIDDEPIEEFCKLVSNQPDLFAVGLEFNRIGYKGLDNILKSLVHL